MSVTVTIIWPYYSCCAWAKILLPGPKINHMPSKSHVIPVIIKVRFETSAEPCSIIHLPMLDQKIVINGKMVNKLNYKNLGC